MTGLWECLRYYRDSVMGLSRGVRAGVCPRELYMQKSLHGEEGEAGGRSGDKMRLETTPARMNRQSPEGARADPEL